MSRSIFWFRRDLRLDDNSGLYHALNQSSAVVPVFIFDTTILNALSPSDRRIEFIWQSLQSLNQMLAKNAAHIQVYVGDPTELIPLLAQRFAVRTVYCNEDYEPSAIARDHHVATQLTQLGIAFSAHQDHVVFAKHQILTQQQKPYTVFTPYKKAWLKALTSAHADEYASSSLVHLIANTEVTTLPTLSELGFQDGHLQKVKLNAGSEGAITLLERFATKVILHYDKSRELPSVPGTSFLSVHNRFGTISIRRLLRTALNLSTQHPDNLGIQTWLGELIWRDFYVQLLYHYPSVVTHTFKAEYQNLAWQNNPEWFEAWKNGQTGYPLVDAAMLQLKQTGYMHNRLRMLVASFLTKDLLIDYRLGEAYFAEQLLDFDLAANNGGWQWAASTGCDAQPYFRVFNPSRQSQRFDPDAQFIKKFLPELASVPSKYLHEPWLHSEKLNDYGVRLGHDYPKPIVEHSVQREAAIKLFKRN